MRLSHRIPALAGLAALLLAAAPAQAGGGGVTLNLKGGSGNRSLRACGIRHHYTLYRRGVHIGLDGTVAGAPGAFTVKVKVKQCIRGQFVARLQQRVGGSAGRYRGSFASGARGYYFARTYYSSGTVLKSAKQYFKVG
ncbi:MAG: hypothetical protein JWO74_1432 [Solirubrobacterales bacterium]|jgi:hypothetical protein|nr:hypothetical protein [Solirubrobacterales bacterium]